MKLWLKILIGVVAGLLIGAVLGEKAVYLEPIGKVFLSLVNMLVVPLVFASMTVGITSIHDPKKLSRVGVKALLIYFVTTAIAIGIGLTLAYLLKPGVGANLGAAPATPLTLGAAPSISDMLISIVPYNPIASLAEGNVLQVIVFAIFLGLAINFSGEKGKPLLRVIESLAEVMYRLTNIVMEFAPYGVAAIMAWVAGTFGFHTLYFLLKFLMANYLGCTIMIFVFAGILGLLAKLNPIPFFKGMGDAIMLALSTNSSSATLPVTLHCVQENLGTSRNISNFVVPLGSTINMNGSAIFQAIAAVFIAQAYSIDLSWQSLLVITITAVLSAVGAAGIPGTGFIMLMVVLKSVGLPTQGVMILFGVDRLREMFSTIVNVLGDAMAAVWIAKSEGELNIDQYNHAELIGYEESEI